MKLREIETIDFLEDKAMYWISLSDMPEAVQQKAREIDGGEMVSLWNKVLGYFIRAQFICLRTCPLSNE